MSTETLISADLAIVGRTSRARMPAVATTVEALTPTAKPRPVEIVMIDHARVYAARCARIAASATLFAGVFLLLVRYARAYTESEWNDNGPGSVWTRLVDRVTAWTGIEPAFLLATMGALVALTYVASHRRAWTRFERITRGALDPLRRSHQLVRGVDARAVWVTATAVATSSVFFVTLLFGLRVPTMWMTLVPESELASWPALERGVFQQRDFVMLLLMCGLLITIVATLAISTRLRRWSAPSMHFGAISGLLALVSFALTSTPARWTTSLSAGVMLAALMFGVLTVTSSLILSLRRHELGLLEDAHA